MAGASASCLIAAYNALCRVGSAKMEFRAYYVKNGVYLEPKILLYRDRVKRRIGEVGAVKATCRQEAAATTHELDFFKVLIPNLKCL
nr:PaRep2a protein [Pyrobaculum aerophilum]